jgi:RNA polymerase sigma factor (sigma-70 family)
MSERPEVRFGRLLQEHGPALNRLAAGYEWDPVERQDLLQEIALAIWRAMPAFRGESSERTFVFRIAHNRGLTHRWQRRRGSTDLTLSHELPDERRSADDRVAHQDQHERLSAAIRRLPEPQRAAVMLTLEGLSHREIAEVLGVEENAVAARLSRARKQLRTLLGEESDQ